MPQGAHVTSVESLEAFRAALLVYLSKARPTLEEVSADVLRTRLWLQNDQRLYWESQVRRRAKELEQAQQVLFGASLSSLRTSAETEKMVVQRARHALEEAEAKLKLVKQWSRDFDNRADPLTRQLESLQTVLCQDMVQAAAWLAQVIRALQAYAEVGQPAAAIGSLAPGASGQGSLTASDEPSLSESGAPGQESTLGGRP